MVQKISILGATGSIGDSTLQVIDAHPDDFCVSAVTAGNNVERLAEICHRFKPKFAAIADEALYEDFKAALLSKVDDVWQGRIKGSTAMISLMEDEAWKEFEMIMLSLHPLHNRRMLFLASKPEREELPSQYLD